MSDISSLTEQLASAKKRYAEIRVRLKALAAEQLSLSDETNTLHARSYSGSFVGIIPDLQEELARARRIEQDAACRVVVFVERGVFTNPLETWVVDKVTPKRICIRPTGSTRTEQFDRITGSHRWRDEVIDLAATFPEGVDSFVANRKIEATPVIVS